MIDSRCYHTSHLFPDVERRSTFYLAAAYNTTHYALHAEFLRTVIIVVVRGRDAISSKSAIVSGSLRPVFTLPQVGPKLFHFLGSIHFLNFKKLLKIVNHQKFEI